MKHIILAQVTSCNEDFSVCSSNCTRPGDRNLNWHNLHPNWNFFFKFDFFLFFFFLFKKMKLKANKQKNLIAFHKHALNNVKGNAPRHASGRHAFLSSSQQSVTVRVFETLQWVALSHSLSFLSFKSKNKVVHPRSSVGLCTSYRRLQSFSLGTAHALVLIRTHHSASWSWIWPYTTYFYERVHFGLDCTLFVVSKRKNE